MFKSILILTKRIIALAPAACADESYIKYEPYMADAPDILDEN